MSLAASPARRSAGESPSGRSSGSKMLPALNKRQGHTPLLVASHEWAIKSSLPSNRAITHERCESNAYARYEMPMSLRGERRRSDGTATTLRSCRADLAAFRGFHALGTSMRHWGCAGRSYPSHSTSRSPPDMVGGMRTARATRAHPTSSLHWSRIGMGLLCAQKVVATSGIFGW
jgi:hypothetical protein